MKTILSLILSFAVVGLIACGYTSGKDQSTSTSLFVDTHPGSCPNLTKDEKGNVVLSWIRESSDTTSVFCYAVSQNGGQSFGDPVVVPGSNRIEPHAENLPKVIFKPSGEILAIWGTASNDPRNKYSGNICYAQSFDGGKSWSAVQPLVRDTAGYDQRYFDVALLKNGEAAIIWLDNRKSTKQEGSALYLATTNGTKGFRGERPIAQPCCQCCRTDLFVDSKNNIHALYRGIIQDSIRDMVHIVSVDEGRTFSAPRRISNDNWVLNACPHTGPAMTENGEGLHFAWFTGGSHKGSFYTRSTDNGSHFIQHDSITLAGKHPQLSANDKGDLGIVWDENVIDNDKVHSRIGIQTRTPDGKAVRKWYVTPDTSFATYPVITMLGTHQPLVAYCQKKGGSTYVAYQRIQSK